ncbi:hypothetical protein L1887_07338 [Cichorium endivia]|nr:hypothetical protein L1887_07338 [Cichorium endivia]
MSAGSYGYVSVILCFTNKHTRMLQVSYLRTVHRICEQSIRSNKKGKKLTSLQDDCDDVNVGTFVSFEYWSVVVIDVGDECYMEESEIVMRQERSCLCGDLVDDDLHQRMRSSRMTLSTLTVNGNTPHQPHCPSLSSFSNTRYCAFSLSFSKLSKHFLQMATLPNVVVLLVVHLLLNSQITAATWCVARNDATEDALQKALDYACGAGADCAPLQDSGLCFLPNTLQAHASYAFNSFYMHASMDSRSCDFSGTATIAKTDPSYGTCVYPSSPSEKSSSVGGRVLKSVILSCEVVHVSLSLEGLCLNSLLNRSIAVSSLFP